MTTRDSTKGQEAFNSLKKLFPNSELFLEKLDLSDLNSINGFITSFK